jgi:hypothetical protein
MSGIVGEKTYTIAKTNDQGLREVLDEGDHANLAMQTHHSLCRS